MYGHSRFISHFEEYPQGLPDFNNNIEYTPEIEEKIRNFLSL
jgi:hypothetical protein